MLPEIKTSLAKIYLWVGGGVFILFIIGALGGWKLPESSSSGGYYGRSGGGSWGIGK